MAHLESAAGSAGHAEDMTCPPKHSTHTNTTLYIATVGQPLHPQHFHIVEKSGTHTHQVLIEKGHSPESMDSSVQLSELELVTKVHFAYMNMGKEQTTDAPKGFAFWGTRKLHDGAVLFELDSAESADWMQRADVIKLFLTMYNGSYSVVKGTTCPLVAEFMPVSFMLQAGHALQQVEDELSLMCGSICITQWIKLVACHPVTQKVAHLVVTMGSPEVANKAIKCSLIMEGKRVSVRKLPLEPQQCLKYQAIGVGHLAVDCPAAHDTCGMCRGMHCTLDCTTTDPELIQCINCNEFGHAA